MKLSKMGKVSGNHWVFLVVIDFFTLYTNYKGEMGLI